MIGLQSAASPSKVPGAARPSGPIALVFGGAVGEAIAEAARGLVLPPHLRGTFPNRTRHLSA